MSDVEVNSIDFKSLPEEVKSKFSKKTISAPGSFQKPVADGESIGIGSKAPENKRYMPAVEVAKEAEQKKENQEEKDLFLEKARELFSFSKYKRILAIVEEPDSFCKRLGIKITADDIDMLLFKGDIEKEIKVLKSGKYNVVLKSLTKKERDQVDQLVGKARDEKSAEVFTQGGVDNYRSIRLLAFSLISVNGSKIEGSLEEKVLYIKQLSDWIYEHLVTTFNMFVFAVNEALTDDNLKNS